MSKEVVEIVVRGTSTMICSFEFYFKCLCILLYLPNATVATKDKNALQRHLSSSLSTKHSGTEERKKLRKYDDEKIIITKTGSLMYKQPTGAPYVSYEGFGLHMCVERCLMIRRCKTITYNLQTMKCDLLVVSSFTADFRDIETTNTVFTEINGWRSEDGERCDATCRGTCQCLKSRKGRIVCVRTVESFVASKVPTIVFKRKILHMSASIMHPGYIYYLRASQRKYIFMANVRETNAEATTRSHHPSIRVRTRLFDICVGPMTGQMSSVLYGRTRKQIYHYKEPRRIDPYMQQLRFRRISVSIKGLIYGIHVLNGQLCALGYSSKLGSHLCQLMAPSPRFYSCFHNNSLKISSNVACYPIEYGVLELVSRKELMYKDAFGFTELNYVKTRVPLSQHPSLYIFSIDSSQIYVLFKRDSTFLLGRYYRTLSF